MKRRLPLYMVNPGERVEIVELRGGRGAAGKLHNMGLYPGAQVEVLHSQRNGPVMVSLNGTRIGLGAGMAFKIIVSPVGQHLKRGGKKGGDK